MKGTIRPWGADLASALGSLTGDLALILVGHGPLEYHPSAPAADQVKRVQDATERWGGSLEFHLFSDQVEYRWDHGAGVELGLAADGDHDLVERSVLISQEARRAAPSLASHAPQGRLRVREFHAHGGPVDLKLEGLA